MTSLLQFDQTTLANMTAALKYVCRKLPYDRDNSGIREHIAEQIIAAANKGRAALAELMDVGLRIVNIYLFPLGRTWLRVLK